VETTNVAQVTTIEGRSEEHKW